MTTQCIPAKVSCPTPHGARPGRIEADFSGGAITSHAGLLLAGRAERSLDLFERVAACFDDARHPGLVVHEVRTLVGQRILGLLSGLEDLNDHEEFRKDPVAGAVPGCLESKREDCEPRAGKSTLIPHTRPSGQRGGSCLLSERPREARRGGHLPPRRARIP